MINLDMGRRKASALLFSLLDFKAFPPVFPHGIDENVLQANIAPVGVLLQPAKALFVTGD
jgi:hypothetical protein